MRHDPPVPLMPTRAPDLDAMTRLAPHLASHKGPAPSLSRLLPPLRRLVWTRVVLTLLLAALAGLALAHHRGWLAVQDDLSAVARSQGPARPQGLEEAPTAPPFQPMWSGMYGKDVGGYYYHPVWNLNFQDYWKLDGK